MAKKKTKSPGTLAENRKARHDYNIEDTVEAGIAPVSYTHLTLPTKA